MGVNGRFLRLKVFAQVGRGVRATGYETVMKLAKELVEGIGYTAI